VAFPDDYSDLPTGFLNTTPQASAHPAHHNALAGAINVLEHTMGLNPEGPHADVAARLGVIDLGVDWSAGDSVSVYSAIDPAARAAHIRVGTAADPDETYGAAFRVSRTISIDDTTFTGDAAIGAAAIYGVTKALASSRAQSVGVFGGAVTQSTFVGAHSQTDAIGVYGQARADTGSTRTGIGGFFSGRREDAGGRATGMELTCVNVPFIADDYVPNGYMHTQAMWVHPTGNADSAAGIVFGRRSFGEIVKFKVALGIQQGTIADTAIRDDSEAHKSLWIRGTHDEGAVVVDRDAGFVLVGASALTGISPPQLLELNGGGVARNPILQITAGGSGVSTAIKFNNPNANVYLGQSGGINNLMVGTVAGDGALYTDTSKTVHIGRAASRGALRVGDNVGIGGGAADSFGGMSGGAFLADAVVVPSANPSGGGLFYSESGALKWRSPTGSVTTLSGNPSLRYTLANHTLSRTLDEADVTLSGLANVVGTLLSDLQSIGMVG
jgi:hypothetical protein